jgi:hypothetical protein
VAVAMVGRKHQRGDKVMLGSVWKGMVVRVGRDYIVVRWSNGVVWTHWTLHEYRVLDWDYTESPYKWEGVAS